jgi:hypothetical protein
MAASFRNASHVYKHTVGGEGGAEDGNTQAMIHWKPQTPQLQLYYLSKAVTWGYGHLVNRTSLNRDTRTSPVSVAAQLRN